MVSKMDMPSNFIDTYERFKNYCSQTLDADGPKILKLVNMKYHRCSETVRNSSQMAHLLEATMESMQAEPTRAFVHLKQLVGQLKTWSKHKKLPQSVEDVFVSLREGQQVAEAARVDPSCNQAKLCGQKESMAETSATLPPVSKRRGVAIIDGNFQKASIIQEKDFMSEEWCAEKSLVTHSETRLRGSSSSKASESLTDAAALIPCTSPVTSPSRSDTSCRSATILEIGSHSPGVEEIIKSPLCAETHSGASKVYDAKRSLQFSNRSAEIQKGSSSSRSKLHPLNSLEDPLAVSQPISTSKSDKALKSVDSNVTSDCEKCDSISVHNAVLNEARVSHGSPLDEALVSRKSSLDKAQEPDGSPLVKPLEPEGSLSDKPLVSDSCSIDKVLVSDTSQVTIQESDGYLLHKAIASNNSSSSPGPVSPTPSGCGDLHDGRVSLPCPSVCVVNDSCSLSRTHSGQDIASLNELSPSNLTLVDEDSGVSHANPLETKSGHSPEGLTENNCDYDNEVPDGLKKNVNKGNEVLSESKGNKLSEKIVTSHVALESMKISVLQNDKKVDSGSIHLSLLEKHKVSAEDVTRQSCSTEGKTKYQNSESKEEPCVDADEKLVGAFDSKDDSDCDTDNVHLSSVEKVPREASANQPEDGSMNMCGKSPESNLEVEENKFHEKHETHQEINVDIVDRLDTSPVLIVSDDETTSNEKIKSDAVVKTAQLEESVGCIKIIDRSCDTSRPKPVRRVALLPVLHRIDETCRTEIRNKPSTSGVSGIKAAHERCQAKSSYSSEEEFATCSKKLTDEVKKLSPEEQKKRRHIAKLEKLLESLRNEIEKCQAREMNLDDLEAEDSSYIYEDKLKKKFVAAWNKLCEITKRTVTTGRPTERYIKFDSTRYKEINRKLERFLNKTKSFPDIHDVKRVIKLTNKKYKLNISSAQVQNIAREAFVDIGEMLQSRRHEDFIKTFGTRETDEMRTNRDPYFTDPALRKKLDRNREEAKTNLEMVIMKYTKLQEDRKNKSSDGEDDDDDEEEEGDIMSRKKVMAKSHKTTAVPSSEEEEPEDEFVDLADIDVESDTENYISGNGGLSALDPDDQSDRDATKFDPHKTPLTLPINPYLHGKDKEKMCTAPKSPPRPTTVEAPYGAIVIEDSPAKLSQRTHDAQFEQGEDDSVENVSATTTSSKIDLTSGGTMKNSCIEEDGESPSTHDGQQAHVVLTQEDMEDESSESNCEDKSDDDVPYDDDDDDDDVIMVATSDESESEKSDHEMTSINSCVSFRNNKGPEMKDSNPSSQSREIVNGNHVVEKSDKMNLMGALNLAQVNHDTKKISKLTGSGKTLEDAECEQKSFVKDNEPQMVLANNGCEKFFDSETLKIGGSTFSIHAERWDEKLCKKSNTSMPDTGKEKEESNDSLSHSLETKSQFSKIRASQVKINADDQQILGCTDTNESVTDVADYPDTNESVTDVADHPDTNESVTDIADYPDTNESVTDVADYPDTNERVINVADYPDTNESVTDVADYPDTNESVTDVAAYPDTNESVTDVADYPDTNESVTDAADYPDTNESVNDVADYPECYIDFDGEDESQGQTESSQLFPGGIENLQGDSEGFTAEMVEVSSPMNHSVSKENFSEIRDSSESTEALNLADLCFEKAMDKAHAVEIDDEETGLVCMKKPETTHSNTGPRIQQGLLHTAIDKDQISTVSAESRGQCSDMVTISNEGSEVKDCSISVKNAITFDREQSCNIESSPTSLYDDETFQVGDIIDTRCDEQSETKGAVGELSADLSISTTKRFNSNNTQTSTCIDKEGLESSNASGESKGESTCLPFAVSPLSQSDAASAADQDSWSSEIQKNKPFPDEDRTVVGEGGSLAETQIKKTFRDENRTDVAAGGSSLEMQINKLSEDKDKTAACDESMAEGDSQTVFRGIVKDVARNEGDSQTVFRGIGKDVARNEGDSQTVFRGIGKDVARNEGDSQTVFRGIGKDVARNEGDSQTVFRGIGKDVARNEGDSQTVFRGIGKDVARNEGDNLRVFKVIGKDEADKKDAPIHSRDVRASRSPDKSANNELSNLSDSPTANINKDLSQITKDLSREEMTGLSKLPSVYKNDEIGPTSHAASGAEVNREATHHNTDSASVGNIDDELFDNVWKMIGDICNEIFDSATENKVDAAQISDWRPSREALKTDGSGEHSDMSCDANLQSEDCHLSQSDYTGMEAFSETPTSKASASESDKVQVSRTADAGAVQVNPTADADAVQVNPTADLGVPQVKQTDSDAIQANQTDSGAELSEDVTIVEELSHAKGIRICSRSKADDRQFVSTLLSALSAVKEKTRNQETCTEASAAVDTDDAKVVSEQSGALLQVEEKRTSSEAIEQEGDGLTSAAGPSQSSEITESSEMSTRNDLSIENKDVEGDPAKGSDAINDHTSATEDDCVKPKTAIDEISEEVGHEKEEESGDGKRKRDKEDEDDDFAITSVEVKEPQAKKRKAESLEKSDIDEIIRAAYRDIKPNTDRDKTEATATSSSKSIPEDGDDDIILVSESLSTKIAQPYRKSAHPIGLRVNCGAAQVSQGQKRPIVPQPTTLIGRARVDNSSINTGLRTITPQPYVPFDSLAKQKNTMGRYQTPSFSHHSRYQTPPFSDHSRYQTPSFSDHSRYQPYSSSRQNPRLQVMGPATSNRIPVPYKSISSRSSRQPTANSLLLQQPQSITSSKAYNKQHQLYNRVPHKSTLVLANRNVRNASQVPFGRSSASGHGVGRVARSHCESSHNYSVNNLDGLEIVLDDDDDDDDKVEAGKELSQSSCSHQHKSRKQISATPTRSAPKIVSVCSLNKTKPNNVEEMEEIVLSD